MSVRTVYFCLMLVHLRISLEGMALILGTGWCEKKARPLLPPRSMLKHGFVHGGAKKKPPAVFCTTGADTSTLHSGGRGLFFFAPTGHETITFQADVSRNYWIAMPVAEVSHTLEIEVYPSIFVDVSALLDSPHSRSALAKPSATWHSK